MYHVKKSVNHQVLCLLRQALSKININPDIINKNKTCFASDLNKQQTDQTVPVATVSAEYTLPSFVSMSAASCQVK